MQGEKAVFAVLILAIIGMDVVLVLAIGMALIGVFGLVTGSTFIVWINGISAGMENVFWFVAFAMMISGLIANCTLGIMITVPI